MTQTIITNAGEEISDLKQKVQDLEEKKVNPLFEVYQNEEASQTLEKTFRSDPEISVFYEAFKYRFHSALVGTKAVSSGIVERSKGLKEQGVSFLIRGIVGEIPFPGASILGDIVECAANAYFSSVAMSKVNTKSRVSSGGASSDLLSESIARHVCRIYFEQIKRLKSHPVIEVRSTLGIKKSVRDKTRLEFDRKAIDLLARCAVRRIFSFIVNEGQEQAKKQERGILGWLEDEHELSFPNRLALSLFYHNKKNGFCEQMNKDIIEVNTNVDENIKYWGTKYMIIPAKVPEKSKMLTDEGIFQRSGLMVLKGEDHIVNPLMPLNELFGNHVDKYYYWDGCWDRLPYYGYARLTHAEWSFLESVSNRELHEDEGRVSSRLRADFLLS